LTVNDGKQTNHFLSIKKNEAAAEEEGC